MTENEIIEIQPPPITCILVQDGKVHVEYRLDDGVEAYEFTEFELLAEAVGPQQARRIAAEAGWPLPA